MKIVVSISTVARSTPSPRAVARGPSRRFCDHFLVFGQRDLSSTTPAPAGQLYSSPRNTSFRMGAWSMVPAAEVSDGAASSRDARVRSRRDSRPALARRRAAAATCANRSKRRGRRDLALTPLTCASRGCSARHAIGSTCTCLPGHPPRSLRARSTISRVAFPEVGEILFHAAGRARIIGACECRHRPKLESPWALTSRAP